MNPEERSLLERTYKMVEENNSILRSLQRSKRIGLVIKSLYWIVIIGLSVGAFYFVQPYIEFMTGALGVGGKQESNTASQQNYAEMLQDLLK